MKMTLTVCQLLFDTSSRFLQHYTAEFSLLNFGIMLIAGFWSAALGTLLDEHEQERSQKYILSNDSNTKSRLELTKLKERGY